MEGTDGKENLLPEITIAQRWSHNFKFQLKKKKNNYDNDEITYKNLTASLTKNQL